MEAVAAPGTKGRTIAIGDVHGCAAELHRLLDAVAPGPGDEVIFVGDYVDRGPGSKAVMDTVVPLAEMTMRKPAEGAMFRFLKGNHEHLFERWVNDPQGDHDVFLRNGGLATLQSYGIDLGRPDVNKVDPDHRKFIRRLRFRIERPPYLFVHAGIDPSRPVDDQNDETLMWVRGEFLHNIHKAGKTVVFGHTPTIRFQPLRGKIVEHVYWDLPYKIGIDSGCAMGGYLTALDLTTPTLYQVKNGSTRPRIRTDLDVFADLPGPEIADDAPPPPP